MSASSLYSLKSEILGTSYLPDINISCLQATKPIVIRKSQILIYATYPTILQVPFQAMDPVIIAQALIHLTYPVSPNAVPKYKYMPLTLRSPL